MISQPEQTSHVSGLYPDQLMGKGVFLENIVKNFCIVQILGNSYGKGLIGRPILLSLRNPDGYRA